MRRVLPAHLVAASLLVGLALPNLVRLHTPVLALVGGLAAAMVVPRGPLLAALVVLVAGWWWGTARLDALDRSVLTQRVGTAGDGVAVTTAAARVGTYAQRQFARLHELDGVKLDERVELELPLGRAPPQGAAIAILAVVKEPKGPDHGFDERTWLRRQGIHVVLQVDRWRVVGRRRGVGGLADALRRWLARASSPGLTGERRALVEGVLLGDESGLSPGLQTAFRRSGLYHLLAVSGENVVLLAGGVLGLAVALGVGRAWAHVGALAAIGAYVLAVGPQPSVIRAAVAGAAVSVAWLAGRLKDAWHVLLLAGIVLLAWNPYTVYDAGFQLSFAAVVAIFVLGGPLIRLLEGYPVPARLRPVLAISAACTLVTAPILWLQFGRVPVYGVVANALVELAVGPLLGLAFAAAVVDPVAPQVATALAWVNGWVAAYIAGCARAISALPGAQASGRAAAVVTACALVLVAACVRVLRARSATR